MENAVLLVVDVQTCLILEHPYNEQRVITNIQRLLQTARERGQETNSTFDNDFLSAEKLYEYYNYNIWNNRFAKVLPMEEAIAFI